MHLGDAQGAEVAKCWEQKQAVHPERQDPDADADADAQGELT